MTVFATRSQAGLFRKKVRLSRRARVLRAGAVVAVLAVSGIAVSHSAFSASVSNTGNSWSTGSLSLTSNTTTAVFSPTGIVPGQSDSKVITITNKAGLAGVVKVYAANASDASSIAQYFTVTVTEGTLSGATFTADKNGTVYNGSLSDFLTKDVSYSTGVGNWTLDGTVDVSKSYQISWAMSSAAPNSSQGKKVSTDFTWEIQNNKAS